MNSITKLFKPSAASAAALGLMLCTGGAAAEGVLNVTNWAEYIAEDTIANFEKEFDIKVT